MGCFHPVQVAVQGFHYIVAQVVAEFVGDYQHALNGDSFHIGIDLIIGLCGDLDLGVVRILLDQLIRHGGIHREQHHIMLGSQVLDGSGGEPGGYERHVHVAVFQSGSRFPEGQVLYLDVIVGDPGSFQDLAGVGFGTGTGGPYGHPFAFHIGQGLDAGLGGGYDLDGFRIQGCQGFQVLDFFALEHFQALDGIIGNVVLDEGDIHFAFLQQVDVGHGGTGGLGRGVGPFHVLVQDVSQGTAQGIVGTGGTAGGDIDEFLLTAAALLVSATAAAAGEQGDCCGHCQHRKYESFCFHSSLLHFEQILNRTTKGN